MNPLNLITGAYDRPARLYPALLLIAPVAVMLVGVFSASLGALQTLVALLVSLGGAFLLTELARDEGKRKATELFKLWGGLPSIQIFRYRNTQIGAITKARYHEILAKLVKGTKVPTKEEEQENPAAVDEIYAAWSDYLRTNTRDTKKYPLIFQENISYGYRRNVWGLRPWGIAVSFVCIVISGGYLWHAYSVSGKVEIGPAGALGITLVILLLWAFRFTTSWVRIPAYAYAERLAESVETFGENTSSKKKTPIK